MKENFSDNAEICHCGRPGSYERCCKPFLDAGAYPRDPLILMRSRYSAYVLRRRAYLVKTWYPSTCPALTEEQLSDTQWQRLEVVRSHAGFKKGWVEFKAHFIDKHEKLRLLHEISEFRKLKDRWVYHAGIDNWPAK